MKLDTLEEQIATEQYETQKWKAIADKRKKLLRRVQNELLFCLFCDIIYKPTPAYLLQHADGCELARELADE